MGTLALGLCCDALCRWAAARSFRHFIILQSLQALINPTALAHVPQTAFCDSVKSNRSPLEDFGTKTAQGRCVGVCTKASEPPGHHGQSLTHCIHGPWPMLPKQPFAIRRHPLDFPWDVFGTQTTPGEIYGSLPKGLGAIRTSSPKPNVLYTWALTNVLQTAFCNLVKSNRSSLGCFWNQDNTRGDPMAICPKVSVPSAHHGQSPMSCIHGP